MHTYYTEGDKYPQSFGITVSSPGDNDRGLAVFFIWRKTTETAAESDDNIMSHPSRFSTYTFPAWKQASTGREGRIKSCQIGFQPFYMWDTFQPLYWLT